MVWCSIFFYLRTFTNHAISYVAGDKLTDSKTIILINPLPFKRTLNIIYFNVLGNVGEGPKVYSVLTYWYFSYPNFKYAFDVHPSIKYPRLP